MGANAEMNAQILYIRGIGEIELLRSSRRRTVSLEVRPDGQVRVHAPARFPKGLIQDFILRKRDWILYQQQRLKEKNDRILRAGDSLFKDRINQTGSPQKALETIRRNTRHLVEERTAYWADRIGVRYGKLSVRIMSSRWGSCSSTGNISFNILLGELPPEVADYVIIHELCHRIEMNHSPRFWALVARQDPDYAAHRKYLRVTGPVWIEGMERLKEQAEGQQPSP